MILYGKWYDQCLGGNIIAFHNLSYLYVIVYIIIYIYFCIAGCLFDKDFFAVYDVESLLHLLDALASQIVNVLAL